MRLVGIIFLGLFVCGPLYASPLDKVSYYFAAHEDDWQLFMNPPAFLDVANPAVKVVFIHITAGDAGLGTSSGGRKHPYYLARENGAENAIRFMVDTYAMPQTRERSHLTLNGHRILRITYGNTVAYFLRLPDGNPQGTGYEHTGFQSLVRLAEGKVSALKALDGSTVYHGWKDLVATLHALVAFEHGSASTLQLNASELDSQINPGDHSDHLTTARAVREATADFPCVNRRHYVDYATANMSENLNSEERQMESSVFAVTAAGLTAFDQKSPWDDLHRSWLGRTYYRAEDSCNSAPHAESGIAIEKPGWN